jgi:hypothetical protein
MTRAGKILLYANLVLSLLMAAWGMALFYGRVNWTERGPQDAGKPEYKKITDRIAELKPLVGAADARYREAEGELAKLQLRRAANQERFQEWADSLRLKASGPNAPAPVVPVLTGGLAISTPNNPQAPIQVEPAKDRAGEALRSYGAYIDDLSTTQARIVEEMGKLEEKNKEYLKQSAEIVGVTEMVGGQIKVIKPGYRQLLQDELDKLANVMSEIERLRPLLVNSYVEIQLLAKRNAALLKQVKDLGGNGSAEAASKVETGVDK